MDSFRISSQFDPTDVDVAPIDRGLHSYNQRSADLEAIRRFACYAKDTEGSWSVVRLLAGGGRHASCSKYGLTKRCAAAGSVLC